MALSAIVVLASGCQPATPHIDHDAYIWQRRWSAAVGEAVMAAAPDVRGWRVLAAEIDARGSIHEVNYDSAVLAAAQRPVVLVVRIDGRLEARAQPRWIEVVRRSVTRAVAGGTAVRGIEIDYDCPTSRLPAYAAFLRQAKQLPAAQAYLAITALPTWLDSRALDDVLAVVDEAVLQVHSVDNPDRALFSAPNALRWVERFAARAPRAMRLALPTYGSRVAWSESGAVEYVESEASRGPAPTAARELAADPREVQQLVQRLSRAPPKALRGFSWFRLPNRHDRRAWSLATWRAVVHDEPLVNAIEVTLHKLSAGAYDVIVSNRGNLDGTLPGALVLGAGRCPAGDGVNGYEWSRRGRARLERQRPADLRAGSSATAGWMRCEDGPVLMYVAR